MTHGGGARGEGGGRLEAQPELVEPCTRAPAEVGRADEALAQLFLEPVRAGDVEPELGLRVLTIAPGQRQDHDHDHLEGQPELQADLHARPENLEATES